MGVDRASLKMLRKQRLRFTVFDDGHHDDNEAEDGSDAIVGSAVVSLNNVAAGGEITGEFELKDSRGRRVRSWTTHRSQVRRKEMVQGNDHESQR